MLLHEKIFYFLCFRNLEKEKTFFLPASYKQCFEEYMFQSRDVLAKISRHKDVTCEKDILSSVVHNIIHVSTTSLY